jgi:pilus assembly protein CpaB
VRHIRLSRSPILFWTVVAGLALLTGMVVAGAVGRANSLATRYGPLRPMVVAARAIERGTTLGPAEVEVRQLPAQFRTEGAFESADEVVGRTAVVPLARGEPVLGSDIAPEGLGAVAALLPAGSRAVAVPTGSSSPALRRGDVVDVLASFDGMPTLAVAVDAAVVDVADESATVAVSPEEAKSVAFALANGAVTVALTPGSSPRTGQRRPVTSSTSTSAPSPIR